MRCIDVTVLLNRFDNYSCQVEDEINEDSRLSLWCKLYGRVKDSMTHKFAKRQKTLKLEMTGDDWGQIMTFNSGQLIK